MNLLNLMSLLIIDYNSKRGGLFEVGVPHQYPT